MISLPDTSNSEESIPAAIRPLVSRFKTALTSPLLLQPLFHLVRQPWIVKRWAGLAYACKEAITDELVDMLYAPSCDPGAQKVFASILTAPPGPTIAELLPKVKHPVLVIWGADDPWTPVTGAKIFQERNENGEPIEFVSIPNTGHCPHDERPDVVNPLMLDWLAKL